MKYTKGRVLVTIILIVLSIILEVAGSLIYLFSTNDNNNFVEILYYSSQIMSSIFVTSGVVIAVWQYYLSCKSTKTNLEIIQVQRAIDLAEYYKDNILKYFPAIDYVFSKVGIKGIFQKIRADEMKDFDSSELNKLLAPAEIHKLQDIQFTDSFLKAVIEANDIYGLDLHFLSFETEFQKGDKKGKVMSIDKNSLVTAFMSNLLNAVLNNLEFFALHFRHETADESVVYQSLHQSYLEFIPYLYYFIANQNTDSSNKLFTNVVWLFEKWKKRKNIQDSDRSQKAHSVERHGTVVGK